MGRGVDDANVRAVLPRGRQHVVEAACLRGNDDGAFFLPVVVPALRACLRVEVDDNAAMAEGFGRAGEIEGEGGLPRPALLGNDRNCFHAIMLLLCLDNRMPCNHVKGKRGLVGQWIPCGEKFIVGNVVRWTEPIWLELKKKKKKGKKKVEKLGARRVTAEVLSADASGYVSLSVFECEILSNTHGLPLRLLSSGKKRSSENSEAR